MLTAPRTLITPTYCQTDIQRQGKACSVGIRVWILSLFNPWRTASPELEQSWYWTAREKKRNEKKMLFARPANSMLLQHSAWGHAASAAPSALERCQRGRSSWESNTSRIQSSHGCSRLWVHVNSLPRSYFLFTGTYFVKLFFFFFMCPLPCCLNDFFAHGFWYPTPFQCIAYSLNSWGTAPWAAAWRSATHNGGIRHEE